MYRKKRNRKCYAVFKTLYLLRAPLRLSLTNLNAILEILKCAEIVNNSCCINCYDQTSQARAKDNMQIATPFISTNKLLANPVATEVKRYKLKALPGDKWARATNTFSRNGLIVRNRSTLTFSKT